MIKKKIYIAGCGGMLGEAFYKQFSDDTSIQSILIDLFILQSPDEMLYNLKSSLP